MFFHIWRSAGDNSSGVEFVKCNANACLDPLHWNVHLGRGTCVLEMHFEDVGWRRRRHGSDEETCMNDSWMINGVS